VAQKLSRQNIGEWDKEISSSLSRDWIQDSSTTPSTSFLFSNLKAASNSFLIARFSRDQVPI
jgi:hypothetical protein